MISFVVGLLTGGLVGFYLCYPWIEEHKHLEAWRSGKSYLPKERHF